MNNASDHYQSIGIICWGLLGDVLMRTPVVHAMRKIFPNAHITVIVDTIGEEVLRYNSDIDEILIFDRKRKPKWKYLFNKIKGYVKIKNAHFDLLIDLYNGRSSANLLRLSNARDKIGFTHSQLPKNTYNLPFIQESLPVSTIHITRSLLKITAPFGADFESYSTSPIFKTRTSIDESMKIYLDEFKVSKPYLLNFGSGGKEKILSMEKNLEIVEYLHSVGYTPLIICNPGQEYLQNEFISNYLLKAEIPHGKLRVLTLEEIGSIMKISNFIITPDTGLYHIAVAIQIPILGIFTYTDPNLVEPDSGIYLHCFQPQDEYVDSDIRFGKNDLELDYLLEQTKSFITLLDRSN